MQLTINGKTRYFDEVNFTLARLVFMLDLADKRLAIERNGEIVPHSQFSAVTLVAGDRLEIVGAVGGG